MWLCVCRLPSGNQEITEWMTQDGADQMASETETLWRVRGKRAVCAVGPADCPGEVAAVLELLAEEEDDA